jgi:DoxX-like family
MSPPENLEKTFMGSGDYAASNSAKELWAGRILSGLPSPPLLVDGAMKLLKPAVVAGGTVRLGHPESVILPLRVVLLGCTIIYLIPRPDVLGAILLTGYLGGAVATHVRVGEGWFSTAFPVILGVLIWGGLCLRDWVRVNKRLGIHHGMYEKVKPWRNLAESQFGIQARLGEYHWQRCRNVEEAVEFHRELIRDHNRMPHWAHHHRNDGKKSPLEVLGDAKGTQIEPADLQRAFGQRYCQRMTDARGFVRIGRWKN